MKPIIVAVTLVVFLMNISVRTVGAERKNETVIAMLALKSDKLASKEVIASALRKALGASVAVSDLEQDKDVISFKTGGNLCIVGLIDRPIPWGDLEGPCATSWMWKEAEAAMRSHVAHFIVTVIGANGSRVERAVVLTRILAGIASVHETAGVYWGDATAVHEPKQFIELAKTATADNPPVALWVDIRIWKDKQGMLSFATTGLAAFGKMEVELLATKGDSVRCLDLVSGAAFLLLTGSDFKDGDTIGLSAEDKVKTSHKKSVWDRPGKVLRIYF